MTTALMSKAAAFSSGTSYIDALMETFSWTGTTSSPVTINYNFSISREGGAVLGASGRTAVLSTMSAWSNVANITFSESTTSAAKLTFSKDNLGEGTAGLTTTYFEGSQIATSEVQVSTDYTDFTVGSFAYLVMLHEVGHALGLKHTGDYGDGSEGPFLPASEDHYAASVMSYNQDAVVTDNNPPITPMIYDIAAIQYLYGANRNYNSADTSYSFSGVQTVQTIWDGGGTDTISASSFGNGAVIDLREGLTNRSTIGSASLWMAFGANIENAVGGSGWDILTGNSLANTLYGLAGQDTLTGSDGADTIFGGAGVADPTDAADVLYGGAGSDALYGNGGGDVIYGGSAVADPSDSGDTMYGGGGSDILYGNGGADSMAGGGSTVDPNDVADTLYGGGGQDTILGNGGNDFLAGGGSAVDPNDAADILYGGVGNDSMLGNGGNDTLWGGAGNDTLHGGVGDDLYAFISSEGADVIALFEGAGVDGGDVIQLVSGINGLALDSTDDIMARITYSGGNAIIDTGMGFSITVQSVSEGTLAAGDFLLA